MKMLNKNTRYYIRKINNTAFRYLFFWIPAAVYPSEGWGWNDNCGAFSFTNSILCLVMIGFKGFSEFSDTIDYATVTPIGRSLQEIISDNKGLR
jgi:hypothetical protein